MVCRSMDESGQVHQTGQDRSMGYRDPSNMGSPTPNLAMRANKN
jgi:hypothetical protein